VYTCPNPSCRKIFSNPLKTLNLQQDSTEPYYACPYCLTKINEISIKIASEPQKAPVEKALAAENQTKGELVGNSGKMPTCHFHLGYLSERSQKEQIPDECLVCKDIVECMLRKMRA
jgi:DNA-directed RNA polymerase subunit RPC12/RpoP